MEKNNIAVIIPMYSSEISDNEKKSLGRCMEILSGYDIFVATYHGLDLSDIFRKYPADKKGRVRQGFLFKHKGIQQTRPFGDVLLGFRQLRIYAHIPA